MKLDYDAICKAGNNYACNKLTSNDVLKSDWPESLIQFKNFEKPRLDFTSEEAKKADTLSKSLSISKNDFRYRKVVNNDVVGEKWYYLKGTTRPFETFKLKAVKLNDTESNCISQTFDQIGCFGKNLYFRWQNVYVVLNGDFATFYYIN